MRLLPVYQETLVLPLSARETAWRLKQLTRPVEKGVEYPEELEMRFLFNGWVEENHFRLSRRVQQPENFLPLMAGRIEGTSVGSILFVHYRLFFSAALFLFFWTVICLLLSLFFLFFHQEYLYAAIALGLGIGNYLVATKNFHLQIRNSRKALEEALNKGGQESGARSQDK